MKTFSRKILLSIAFCFALMSARAQFVTIPDTNFVNWLNANGFASCMNGNLMDTTCSAIVNATNIDCSSAYIYDLTGIEYFHSLKYLWAPDNFLSYVSSLPSTLVSLDCDYNQLTSLPNLPDSLINLYCSHNQLISLPNLPLTLRLLWCSTNSLISLPVLPSGLTGLYCYYNQLSSLPVLPLSLKILYCYNNQLTSLSSLPDSIFDLRCDHNNRLSLLPILPSQLVTLICYNDSLTSLPSLPPSLVNLSCHINYLTSLPPLPPLLEDLSCYSNYLSSLPALPPLLTILTCNDNYLAALPLLPSSLINLSCNNNRLLSLPILPSSLDNLDCSFNQLISLPNLPDTMNYIWINNNPNLSCLPTINSIYHFEWNSTAITCLPNAILIGNYAYPQINNLPICVPPSPCFTVTNTIEDLVSSEVFNIYPNPILSATELKLLFNSPSDKQATFTIYDLSGRTVFTTTIFTSQQTQSIALPSLAAGVYNCVVSAENGSSHQKLVVVEK